MMQPNNNGVLGLCIWLSVNIIYWSFNTKYCKYCQIVWYKIMLTATYTVMNKLERVCPTVAHSQNQMMDVLWSKFEKQMWH